IDGVIDAAGFAYGDQFGAARTGRAADAAERWRRDGKAVILLPQAFGPFSTEPIRTAARRLIGAADLVFARDRVSLAALEGIGAMAEHVSRAPDFTISVPALPSSAAGADAHGYLVPNAKMLRHLESDARDTYLDFLVACGSEIRERNLQVRILLHESNEDAGIASDLAQRLDGAPVVSEEDPQRLKGRIAASRVVVGSRFHALVAALSQSVPVVASGWSHKYAELLADYGCPDALVTLPAGREEAQAAIARALDEPSRTASIERLTRSAAEQRRQTDAMWARVREVLARTARARRRGGFG
ncbi:MAG TPA: polysaccharide pyruvyl transferase family protein, partial [Candidatus Limnocylindria bacterium]